MDFFLQPLNLGLLAIMLVSGAMLVRQVAQPGAKAVSPQAAIAIKDRENGVLSMCAKSTRWRLAISRVA